MNYSHCGASEIPKVKHKANLVVINIANLRDQCKTTGIICWSSPRVSRGTEFALKSDTQHIQINSSDLIPC